jgi:hypothetical protein
VDGRKLPVCAINHVRKGHFKDKEADPADARRQRFNADLEREGEVVLAEFEHDSKGYWRRKRYIDVYKIINVKLSKAGQEFDVIGDV